MKKIKKIGRAAAFFLLSLLLSLFLLGTLSVLVAGLLAAKLDTTIDDSLLLENARDKTTRLYCYNEQGEAVELVSDRVSGYENALFCPIEEIPPVLRNAFIAIEDKRF